jgi:acetyltransferase-like isoleucine patch superfamily enzyme
MVYLIQRWLLKYRVWRCRQAGLSIGDDCRLHDLPEFGSEPYLISIGQRVSISTEVVFITHDGGTIVFRDDPRYRHVIKYGRITIRDNCMIGTRTTILPGVTIGPNSVVGACSLVSRNVPPNSVVSGNPARVVMSTDAYAEWCLAATRPYDHEAYRRDKRRELVRLFPARSGLRIPAPANSLVQAPSPTQEAIASS